MICPICNKTLPEGEVQNSAVAPVCWDCFGREHEKAVLHDVYRAGVAAGIKAAATCAENVKNGYTANIRVTRAEQEFVRDPDGPWVLNSNVAAHIRALDVDAIATVATPPQEAPAGAPLKGNPKLPCKNISCPGNYAYVDDDYGSLSDGGSYEIYDCDTCGHRRREMLPD